MSASRYTGGCACRAIRYQCHTEAAWSFLCQCRKCQRFTGTGHACLMAFPSDTVDVTGKLRFYESAADDGNRTFQGFCEHCGSPVMNTSAGYPQWVFIHAASLDDPDLFQPAMVAWHRAKQPWDVTPAQLTVAES